MCASFNSPSFASVILPCLERFKVGFEFKLPNLTVVIKKPVTLQIDQSGNHKTKVVVFTITTLKKLNQLNQSNSYPGGKGQHFSLARWLLSHFLITLFQDHIKSNGITDEHVSKLREVIMKMNYSSSKSNNFGLSSF